MAYDYGDPKYAEACVYGIFDFRIVVVNTMQKPDCA